MIVVADTSPLLDLARIGRLDLVEAALGTVTLPRTVLTCMPPPVTPPALTIRHISRQPDGDAPPLRQRRATRGVGGTLIERRRHARRSAGQVSPDPVFVLSHLPEEPGDLAQRHRDTEEEAGDTVF